MKVKVNITLTVDEYTEDAKEVQVEIEESFPDGFQNLDQWEQDVRRVGFQSMRELFRYGIELYEETVLSRYTHKSNDCHLVKRGLREFTFKTAFGEVTFLRRRMYCHTCGEWVIPINQALGLHDEQHERATTGFKELSCLCAVRQSYRQSAEMLGHITHDPAIVSHEHVRQIVQAEGKRVRTMEEAERKGTVFHFVKGLQDSSHSSHRRSRYRGTGPGFYIFLDGTFVRSNAGKNRFHEGKIGFMCNEDREPAGNRVVIPMKRYVSSFEDSYVLGGRMRGEALRLAMRIYGKIFLIGDGGRWIRQIHEQSFPEAVYILDWYHLKENLYKALDMTLSQSERRRAYRQVSRCLWRGLKEKALNELSKLQSQLLSEGKQGLLDQRQGLKELIDYIQSNWDGIVNYRDIWRSGHMIASSLVEKAVDLVIAKRQKKKQSMHWSRMGAENICALRTLWLNGDWQDYWRERREKAA